MRSPIRSKAITAVVDGKRHAVGVPVGKFLNHFAHCSPQLGRVASACRIAPARRRYRLLGHEVPTRDISAVGIRPQFAEFAADKRRIVSHAANRGRKLGHEMNNDGHE
jgi:hypothetical protein